MPDIFLSYNREDQQKAKLIANALAEEGFDVWWDTILRAGQTYDEVTERQLHASRAVVVLWSSRSVKSKWVRAEATLGDRKSALIPVMIEPCDRPIMFELIQTADLVGWEGDTTHPSWLAFIADVREHVERKAAAAKSVTPEAGPVVVDPPKAQSADSAGTVEAAFWMSIQEGDDVEEFESYLERYPQGHFASLAKKRVAALTAAKAAPVVAPPSPPEPPPKAAPAPEPLLRTPSPQAAPRVDAFQQKQPVAQAAKKSGSPLPLVIGAVIAVIAVGGAAFAFMPKSAGEDGPVETVAAIADPVAPAVAEPSAVAEAPAVSAPVEAEPPPVVAVSKTFRDCDDCPEMMRLEGGVFTMGSSSSEAGHRAWEGPQREVTIAPLAVGLKEVTFAEWDACVAAGGCGNYTPTDKGWGRGARPVMMVSWNDAQAYLKWLSGKAGKTYRLPTEAEWEFAARGGTTTTYWWGAKYVSGNVPHGKTDAAGSHEANGFGLFDVSGNVAEWVQDCYVNTFADAPKDGSAVSTSNCQRVIRGGSWKGTSSDLRIANRSRLAASTRDTSIGFRVAVTE